MLIACRRSECDKIADTWIHEAPAALDEFLLVKDEVLSNEAFIDSFSSQGGFLFIGGSVADTNSFDGFEMPRLKEWFRNGHEYIRFSPSDTSACYRKCWQSHGAYIKLGAFDRSNYQSGVKILDTLPLKHGWKAEVTRCNNCGS